MMGWRWLRLATGLVAMLVVAVGAGAASAPAVASAGGVAWSIHAVAQPTNFNVGDARDRYKLVVVNAGDRLSEGELVIKDRLPAGMEPTGEVEILEPLSNTGGPCSIGEVVECEYSRSVPAGDELEMTIGVRVSSPAVQGAVVNEASVSGAGGGAASTSVSSPVGVGPAPFGVAGFGFAANNLSGEPDLQAGGHPFSVTTTVDLNTHLTPFGEFNAVPGLHVIQEPKDVVVTMPAGFVGDPLATERCPEVDLDDPIGDLGGGHFRSTCPAASVVGSLRLIWAEGKGGSEPFPLYNVVSEHGYPAELGTNAGLSQPLLLYADVVPSTSGYRLQIGTPGAIRALLFDVESVQVTVFGEPRAMSGAGSSMAFVRNPTRCTSEPLSAMVNVSAWEGGIGSGEATAYPDVSGCGSLSGAAAFDPVIAAHPEISQADSPSGYEVDLRVPQAPDTFGSLATPDLRDATVTFPAGVAISPASANGPRALEGCTASEIDLLGTELGEGHPGGNGSPYDDGLAHAAPGHCPEGSRIGTVRISTPLLEAPLEGRVFLAAPSCGGEGQAACTEAAAEEGGVFGIYMEAEASGSGVIIKVPGTLEVGGYGPHSRETGLAPGQLRARFVEAPQLPFEELQLELTGGPRAPLANPQSCGTATLSGDFKPWSAPESGPDATSSSSFAIDGCADAGSGFAPGFAAGTVSPLAGAFSPFTLTLSRQDGEQDLGGVQSTLPEGLLAKIAGVAECGEAEASAGTCSGASQIGTVAVAVGAGSEPLVESGRVYLTGPYNGGPFGIAVVVPAVAGPFNLGNVVVRGSIRVDPLTARASIVSDPFPSMIDGVPLRIKSIDVQVDRPGFTFNPTDCAAQAVTGSVAAVQGASATVSSPFAVGGCAGLSFKPSFAVSTSGQTSKAEGASLHVDLSFPNSSAGSADGPGGGQANVAYVKVDLPKALPSRLTTLQQACTAAQFAANPAGCPAASVVGHAVVRTQVLPVPLEGPAYFVSNGGEAFPNLIMVLQGDGVTIELVGDTFIDKDGVTSSTFKSTPDVPFEFFELTLPQGPDSALAANGSLCSPTKMITVRKKVTVRARGRKRTVTRTVEESQPEALAMPTEFKAQNGATLSQSTPVSVTACPKTAPLAKRTKHPTKRRSRLRRRG